MAVPFDAASMAPYREQWEVKEGGGQESISGPLVSGLSERTPLTRPGGQLHPQSIRRVRRLLQCSVVSLLFSLQTSETAESALFPSGATAAASPRRRIARLRWLVYFGAAASAGTKCLRVHQRCDCGSIRLKRI